MFYDYAKIYQSVNGYDFILNNKKIDLNYIHDIKRYFDSKFKIKFGLQQLEYLKYLSCSLVISLQPFHNRSKNKRIH